MTSTELITVEQVEDVLLHGGELAVVESDAIQEDLVRRVLAAGTVEEAFAEFTTYKASDLEGVPIKVNGIAWAKSAFDQGPQIYALLRCTVPDVGDDVVVSMGGRTLMASFVWAQRNAAMPIKGAFVKQRSHANPERAFWTFKLA